MLKSIIKLFEKKKRKADPLGILADDPIGTTIRNLANQQAEAAARGERITNRIPAFIRVGRLKLQMVERLKQLDSSELGVSVEVYSEILAIDANGAIGLAAESFDRISPKIRNSILADVEDKVRAEDLAGDRANFDDLERLFSRP